jgi:DNA-binding NarL/FixJ family response regulator
MNLETAPATCAQEVASIPLRALCIARHSFLSEHIARYFANMGVVTTTAVGLDSATAATSSRHDVVICDYDILANLSLERWEQNALLSKTPVVAVSLSRRADELHLFDIDGIAGFLYLPTLEKQPALQILNAAAARPKYRLASRISAPRAVERS